MEDSYNSFSNNKRENYSETPISHDINDNYRNMYNNKINSFFEYENTSINPYENDILGNSDIKYNFENKDKYLLNDNDNDISSEDEYENKLNYLKIGILNSKLHILIKIIYSRIQIYYYYFISKTKLKIKCNEIFLQGDNFLYSRLNSKTSDVNKYYAFKKIIYIFRKKKYDKLIKISYFNKWKILKNKFIFDEKIKKNSIKITKFISILTTIFNKKLENEFQGKYCISKWNMLTNYDTIQNIKITKAILILSNLLNRKLRFVFKKFPRNYLNIKNEANIFKKSNNHKQITYIIGDNNELYQKGIRDFYDKKRKYKSLLRQNKLLKIIERLEVKKRVNKNVYIFFNLLKNSTQENKAKKEQIFKLKNDLSDLKYDSMLNAATMIKIILNHNFSNNLFTTKKYFMKKLYNYHKFFKLFNQYKANYNGIIGQINNEEAKGQLIFVRKIYKKVFALQKILIINNRHKFCYSDLNIQLKYPLLQKYFYLWKNKILAFSVEKNLKNLATQKIYLLLYDIFTYKIKRKYYFRIRKKIIQSEFNKKKYYYFSYYLYHFLKHYLLVNHLKYSFYSISNFINNNEIIKEYKINIFFKSKRLFMIYKKYINLGKYKYLLKWSFNSQFITLNKNKFKQKMKNILIHIDKSILINSFYQWKENINNNECQTSDIKKQFFLYKFISMKPLMLKYLHFKKWLNIKNTTEVLNYENLLMKLDQLRKDNDDLIAIYYKKRQEYAKTLYDYNYMKKYYCINCINEKEDEIDYMSLKSSDIKEAGKMANSLIISQNKVDISKDNSNIIKSKNFEEKNENENTKNKVSYGLTSEGNNNFIVNEENKLQSSNSNMISLSEDEDLNSHIGKKIPQCTGETIFSKNLFMEENGSSNNNIMNTNNYKSSNKNNEDEDSNRRDSIIKEYKKEYEEQKKYYENYIKILLEKKNELLQMKNMLKKQKNENLKSDEK